MFAKFANRSAKDCSVVDRRLFSVRDVILLVKISEYLTEALSEDEEEGSELILRQY